MICHMHQPNMFINTHARLHDVGLRVRRAVHVAEEAEISDRCRDAQDPRPQSRGSGDPRQVGRRRLRQGRHRCSTRSSRTRSSPTTTATAGISAASTRATARATCSTRTATSSPTTIRDKWKKAVHLQSIHVDVGMQCVDCHFAQDNHGNGYIKAEVMGAVEIAVPGLPRHGRQAADAAQTPGPSASPIGKDLPADPQSRRQEALRVGRRQDSSSARPSTPGLEWKMSLVQDTVDPGLPALQREGGARAS